MKNNKLSRLLEPSLGLYLACLVLFALASALFSTPLAVIEGVVVIILYLYLRRSNSIRKREMLRYIESVTANMDVATQDTMVNSPLPMVIFHPDTEEIIWSNERFLQLTDEQEHLFDTTLSALGSWRARRPAPARWSWPTGGFWCTAPWSAPRRSAAGPPCWPPPTGWRSPSTPR